MFGDPITNTKEWSQKALKQVLRSGEKVTYGIVQTGDNVPGGIPVFRPVDIANGNIPKRIELKCTTEEISNRYKRTLLDGSELLITIRGSVGEVFLVNTDFAGCNVARNIVPLRLDERIVSRSFMKAFFQQPSTVQYIKSITKGIALQGVNICEFREMAIILPPLTLQRQFVLFLEQLDKSKVTIRKSIEKLELLYKALLQEYFG